MTVTKEDSGPPAPRAPETPATLAAAPMTAVPTASTSSSCPSSSSSTTRFSHLPAELRLQIWSCSVEPRLVVLEDLVSRAKSYPLPVVTQLNAEARYETRDGYEPVGRGSYFDFSRDILVCDYRLADQPCPDPMTEELAPRVERILFWDCVPDEESIKLPTLYSEYLTTCYHQKRFGQIIFDRFWFPNAREFWSVKVGEVDDSWKVHPPPNQKIPFETWLQQSAREFRYFVDDNVIEIAPLDLSASEARFILREGRCGKDDCRQLNAGRIHIVSKVNILDGKYTTPEDDGRTWSRVLPASDEKPGSAAGVNRIRWAFVERSLTFLLSHDAGDERFYRKTRSTAE